MPVHFNSFIADKDDKLKAKLFSNIVTKYVKNADNIFVTIKNTYDFLF